MTDDEIATTPLGDGAGVSWEDVVDMYRRLTPIDSGTQPDPHYCTSFAEDESAEIGCPDWPACLSLAIRQAIDADPITERLAHAVASADVDNVPVRGLVNAIGMTLGVVLLFAVLWAVLA